MAITEKNLPELKKHLALEAFDSKFRKTTKLVGNFDDLEPQVSLDLKDLFFKILLNPSYF